MSSTSSSHETALEGHWHSLQPRITKLINSVSSGTIGNVVQRFERLGFPWPAEPDTLGHLARLMVASFLHPGNGFYAECNADLVHRLSSMCSNQLFEDELKQAVLKHLVDILAGMSIDVKSEGMPLPKLYLPEVIGIERAEAKLRDCLVNTCKFVAGLFERHVCSEEDIHIVLSCLGVIAPTNLPAKIANDTELASHDGVPQQVTMLSGRCPATQPIQGESFCDYRERLARELRVPPFLIELLAGDSLVDASTHLEDVDAAELRALVRQLHIKEEYRIEAVCTLLGNSMSVFRGTEVGWNLLEQVVDYLEAVRSELPKRAQFMIMDLSTQRAKCAQEHVLYVDLLQAGIQIGCILYSD